MAHTFFAILKHIFDSSDWVSEGIVFNKFSLQYVGLIMFVLCAILFTVKDLKYILIINDKGVYMIMIFCIYIMYLGIYSLLNFDISFVIKGEPGKERNGLEVVYFTCDISTLIGIFSTANMVHPVVTGIMKKATLYETHTFNLGVSYSVVMIFYSILGIFGMFAVAGLYKGILADGDHKNIPETMMDLLIKENSFITLPQRILSIISLILIFIQLTTVLPVICFFTRRQFFDLIYGPKKRIPSKFVHLFNQSYNIICLIIHNFLDYQSQRSLDLQEQLQDLY
jgi:hypothetical protein